VTSFSARADATSRENQYLCILAVISTNTAVVQGRALKKAGNLFLCVITHNLITLVGNYSYNYTHVWSRPYTGGVWPASRNMVLFEGPRSCPDSVTDENSTPVPFHSSRTLVTIVNELPGSKE
jgi:hypothetical protein